MLTIEQILAAKDCPTEKVSVPEWGGDVYVRRLSANDAIDHVVGLRAITGGTDAEVAKARLAASLAAFLCDESGKPLCTLEQARALADKSAQPVNRVVTAGHRLNATDDAEVQQIAKNSAPSLDATSPSA
jgi:hypothetical protein